MYNDNIDFQFYFKCKTLLRNKIFYLVKYDFCYLKSYFWSQKMGRHSRKK
jgi:hypothetical protein